MCVGAFGGTSAGPPCRLGCRPRGVRISTGAIGTPCRVPALYYSKEVTKMSVTLKTRKSSNTAVAAEG